jgi:hypothetical protein
VILGPSTTPLLFSAPTHLAPRCVSVPGAEGLLQEGAARPGVEESPKRGIKWVEIHTLVLVTALAKVVY